jgi:A/G-specific adenine glycosylase
VTEESRAFEVLEKVRAIFILAKALPKVAHCFTHFKLDIEPRKVMVTHVAERAAAPGVMWLSLEEALGAAIPAPVRSILSCL